MEETVNEESPKLEIQITNIVATASLGHPIDLLELTKAYFKDFWVEYRPEQEKNPRGATLYMKKLMAIFRVFESGAINCLKCKSENEVKTSFRKLIRGLKEAGFIVTNGNPKITINNIVWKGNLKKKIGCGIITRAYPGAIRSKLHSEAWLVPSEKPLALLFSNGKLIGFGAKTVELATKTLEEISTKINEALEIYDKRRAMVCKIERFNPTVAELVKYGNNLSLNEKTRQEVLQEAEIIIVDYCRKIIRDPFGHEPKNIAAGAAYLACRKFSESSRLPIQTQREIAMAFVTQEITVRESARKIAKALGWKEDFT